MKNQTLSLSLAAILVSGVTVLAAGAPASADQFSGEPFAFKFAYERSELDTEASAERMLERLHGQVKQHCIGEFQNNYDRRARQCVSETMTRVVGEIGSSTLASVHSERLG